METRTLPERDKERRGMFNEIRNNVNRINELIHNITSYGAATYEKGQKQLIKILEAHERGRRVLCNYDIMRMGYNIQVNLSQTFVLDVGKTKAAQYLAQDILNCFEHRSKRNEN